MNTATQLYPISNTTQPTSIHGAAVQVGLEQLKAIYRQFQNHNSLEMSLDFDEIQSVFDFEFLALNPQSKRMESIKKFPTICLEDPSAIADLQQVIQFANNLLHPSILSVVHPQPEQQAMVQTYQGDIFNLLQPSRSQINIEDIAHALSQQCRFNGHTTQFYSVAQHSVLVSHLVPPCLALEALMHDAAEAYLGDVVTPLKTLLPKYKKIESNLTRAIFEHIGLSYPPHSEIKHADLKALATECRDLLQPCKQPEYWGTLRGVTPSSVTIQPLAPPDAKQQFLDRYFQLQKAAIALV
jgi:5'-deoxynucleotidase YfbR-like HD superfamily hydrolase